MASNKKYLTLPIGYKRTDNKPLEDNTLFLSLEAATNYVNNDITCYIGQVISVIGDKFVTLYLVDRGEPILDSSNQPILDSDGNPLYTKSLRRLRNHILSKNIDSGQSISIEHNLDTYPIVTVIDSNTMTECECLVTHIDRNKLTVSWNGTFRGLVTLRD